MTLPLPPGVTRSAFDAALRAFKAAVGESWVFDAAEDVALYRDAYSPLWGEADELWASAAVAPETVAQVQEIVRIANRYRVALYPISTGRNLAYGGSAPCLTGSVVVDLKRMNRILEVDERRYFALVEPGVSYFDLYRHIQDRNLKVWIDCPDPGWGSLVGNSLEHGIGYTWNQYRDHFASHCGMEVVLANGEVMRTGMGALPGSKSWQDFRYGYGPYVDGLFSQGNFGIVTKMGFWLMPEPEAYLMGRVTVPKRADLIRLVDISNQLEYQGLCGNWWYDSPLVGSPFAPRRDTDLDELLTKGWPSDEALDQLMERKGMDSWGATVPFYGSIDGVKGNWDYAKRLVAKQIPGAGFELLKSYSLPLTPKQIEQEHRVEFGIPSLAIFGGRSKRNPNPSDGHLDFSVMLPRTGEAVFQAQKVFFDASVRYGIKGRSGPLITPFTTASGPMYRGWLMILFLPTSRSDQALNRKTRADYARLVQVAAEQGWGEYRAHNYFQDVIAGTYSFNDHALRKFRESLKDAVDPNGILAPGRGGVWPARLRHLRRVNPR